MPSRTRAVAAIVLGWGLLAATAATAADGPRRPEVPALEVERYTLPNGLTVLLHEDHRTPVAAVDVYYKVGSKDERPGKTGFAHLFEHLMFLGSQHHDAEFSTSLDRLGAEVNAATSEDATEYHERIPSHALERTLWLEADRMGFLLPAMTAAKLDAERKVVANERRETIEDAPYSRGDEAIREALYPPGHPYRHEVLGSMADLSAASLADVSTFFRTYYAPDNAVLCVAGDFDPDRVRGWIARYFGPLPRGTRPAPPGPDVPRLDGPKRIRLTDAMSLPRARLVWPTIPAGHPDEPALDILAAVLGGLDKEDRLSRALIYDRPLAAEAGASHPTRVLSGEFEVTLLAHPGGDLDDLLRRVDREIERLKEDGPTPAEVRKARNRRESDLVTGLQSVAHRAAVLNLYQAHRGDPLAYRAELERVFDVTPADVRRVARRYLGPNRVELQMVTGDPPPDAEAAEPPPRADADAPAAVVAGPRILDDFDRSVMPPLGPTPRFRPPRFERRRLSNGLEVRIVERHDLPIVTVDLAIKAGEAATPKGKEGLASIVASLLEEGTTSRTLMQMADELAETGSTLGASSALQGTMVSLTTLSRHLDRGLDLLADVVRNPSFPEASLERLKVQRLSVIESVADNSLATAEQVFPMLLYGRDHPYGRPIRGTHASLASITRADVVSFYRRIMVPANAAVVVVGDVRPDAIAEALEARLGDWPPGPLPPPPSIEPIPAPPARRRVGLVDWPMASQSVLFVGRIAAARTSPDHDALVVLNAILAGQFSSRINLNLRHRKGYTYGFESDFGFYRGPGPFQVSGMVETGVTREALAELFKELEGIVGDQPVTDAELAFARERLILGFPARFETTFAVSNEIRDLFYDGLPDDELERYQPRLEALTRADIDRVARKYITPDRMTVLIVGDRERIDGPLRELPWARAIHHLDIDGHSLDDPFEELREKVPPVKVPNVNEQELDDPFDRGR